MKPKYFKLSCLLFVIFSLVCRHYSCRAVPCHANTAAYAVVAANAANDEDEEDDMKKMKEIGIAFFYFFSFIIFACFTVHALFSRISD